MRINNCRICKNTISPFMTFGNMPIANCFLEVDDFQEEYFFELMPGFCEQCGTVQLIEQPEPEKMFHENYAFFSQTSQGMIKHFQEYAAELQTDYLTKQDDLIVELGSNDGILLKNFKDHSTIKHLGIEPSANVAQVAKDNGINTWCKFFNSKTAIEIMSEYGKAKVITCANVMCHIPNLLDLAKGVELLLSDDGVLIFEDPYLGDVVNKTSYDQFYDEHVYMFSVHAVQNIFAMIGLEVFAVKPLATHGGSMRYYLCRAGKYSIQESVAKQLATEDQLQLMHAQTYVKFKDNCENSRQKLNELLNNLRKQGKHIAGYAATSKSTTVLNYCQITADVLEYISDTTPIKQGKFSPGMHIPIKPYSAFLDNYPDYALLLAWNHANEIFAKEQEFNRSGGLWISFVPEVKVLA